MRDECPAVTSAVRVAYLTSRFPKATETFVLNEILRLPSDWVVDIYPLLRGDDELQHPGARALASRVRRLRLDPFSLVTSQIWWLVRIPGAWFSSWATTMATAGAHGPVVLAKAVWATLWAMTAARRVRATGADHVHAHWATYPTHAAMVISRLTGVPFSFTAHAHDIYAHGFGLAEKIAAARFVVTISDYNRRLLVDQCLPADREKVAVVRCGVDGTRFAPPRIDDPPAGVGRRPQIVCTGALQEKKGQRYLIEALALLAMDGVDVDCVLIGDGPDRAALQQLVASRGLADRVTFAGWRTTDEVRTRLAETDVFVLPSVVAANGMQEGIPVALMEAMACEVPVVSCDISGISELVHDGLNGVLVPPADAPALARELRRVISLPEVARGYGRRGRATVLAEYDLDRNVQQLAEMIHDSVIAHRPAVPVGEPSR